MAVAVVRDTAKAAALVDIRNDSFPVSARAKLWQLPSVVVVVAWVTMQALVLGAQVALVDIARPVVATGQIITIAILAVMVVLDLVVKSL